MYILFCRVIINVNIYIQGWGEGENAAYCSQPPSIRKVKFLSGAPCIPPMD